MTTHKFIIADGNNSTRLSVETDLDVELSWKQAVLQYSFVNDLQVVAFSNNCAGPSRVATVTSGIHCRNIEVRQGATANVER